MLVETLRRVHLARAVLTLGVLATILLGPGPAAAVGPSGAAPQRHLIPAVVYVGQDGSIHEIALKGVWKGRNLTVASGAPGAPGPSSRVMAFRRGDGVSMVLYRGTDMHVHCLYLAFVQVGGAWIEEWTWADLTAIAVAPDAASDPWGYVRSDGIAAVVYSGNDGGVHELRLEGTWQWANLTSLAGAPASYGRPTGYVRGDGVNAVVYVGAAATGSQIHELRLDGGWKWASLTSLASAPPAASEPSAYVRSDGISTINYRGTNGHVQDVRLDSGWQRADLTALAGAPPARGTPAGYVRNGTINAIVYSSSGPAAGEICELRLEDTWQYYCFGAVPGAITGYAPRGYVRADGLPAVVYIGTDSHVHELRLEGTWFAADLSALTNWVLPVGELWPYNRSGVVAVYLPMMRR